MVNQRMGSLGLRVLVASFAVLAIPLLVYMIVVSRKNLDEKLRETVLRLKDLGRGRALLLSQLVKFDMRAAEVITNLLGLEEEESHTLGFQDDELLREIAKSGGFTAIFYLSATADGRYTCISSSDDSMIGKDFSSYGYLRRAVRNDQFTYVGPGGANSEEEWLYISRVITSPEGRVVGVLTVAASITNLLSRVVASEESAYHVDFSVLTKDNIVVASSRGELSRSQLHDLSQASSQIRRKSRQHRENTNLRNIFYKKQLVPLEGVTGSFAIEWGKEKTIAIELPIFGTQLNLLVEASEAEVFKQQYRILLHTLTVSFLIFASGGWALFWITQRMSAPLQSLCNAMVEVGKGNLNARFTRDRVGFEINVVGKIFNEMILSLKRQMSIAENERAAKESLATELQIGHEIQLSILPQGVPTISGIDIGARYLSAKEVGGDFYDLFLQKDAKTGKKSLVVTVADASGKGVSACLYSLCLRSMLRSFYLDEKDTASIATQANDLFCRDTGDSGMFVTAFIALYDPETRVLRFSCCGHNPAILVRANGTLERLTTEGIAMGVLPHEQPASVGQTQLYPGDLVCFYTDGVTEAHDKDNLLFGEKRLEDSLVKSRLDGAQSSADQVVEAVHAFAKEAGQHDDITVVTLKVS